MDGGREEREERTVIISNGRLPAGREGGREGSGWRKHDTYTL